VQFFAGLTADRMATREAVLKLFTNFVLFFLAGQLIPRQADNGRSLKWWGAVATLLAFGLSVLALAQLMTTGHGVIYWTVATHFGPFGPYVSPNDYCGMMEMLIPVAVGYILSGASPWVPRIVLWLGVVVGLASIVISGSRAGVAVVLIELLVFGFIIYRYRPQGTWHRAFPLVVGLVLISAGLIGWLATSGRMGNRALSLLQPDNSFQMKVGDRLWVARDTLRIARSRPWLGVGVGTFETVFPAFMTHPSDMHWTHAHNDFAEGLAEAGLAAGVLILWGLLLFFRRALLHIPERLRIGWGWIPMGATVGVVGLLCHSLVDFNLRVPANAAWFVVCVAVATLPLPSPARSLRQQARTAESERREGFLT
jgi:O-antigen ligase